jgi:phosphoenolpyruvate carboxylase
MRLLAGDPAAQHALGSIKALLRLFALYYGSMRSIKALCVFSQVIRRLNTFGLNLIRLDIRQESTRHEEVY